MDTRAVANLIQRAAKVDGVRPSPIAGCASCMSFSGLGAEEAPHVADPAPGLLDRVPWKWVGGTLAVSVPLTVLVTYKMAGALAKSQLGRKLLEKRLGVAVQRKKK